MYLLSQEDRVNVKDVGQVVGDKMAVPHVAEGEVGEVHEEKGGGEEDHRQEDEQ